MTLELVEVINSAAAKTVHGLTPEERVTAPFAMVYDAATLEKDEGNKCAKKNDLRGAVGR